jgi:hypothetical protein
MFHDTVNFGTGPIASSGIVDGYVVSLDTAGTTRFARHLGAAMGGSVRGLHADPAGNVVVTGPIEGTADLGTGALAPLGNYDLVIASFAGDTGVTRFAQRYGGADYDEGNSLTVAPGGAIIAAGTFHGTVDLGTGPITGESGDNGFLMMVAP